MQIIRIDANQNSYSGGNGKPVYEIKAGDRLVITCAQEDTWNLGNGEATNADGSEAQNTFGETQWLPTGTLVGSFDGGQTVFPVGTALESVVTAPETRFKPPTLSLYCYDGESTNMSGSITAYISTHAEG